MWPDHNVWFFLPVFSSHKTRMHRPVFYRTSLLQSMAFRFQQHYGGTCNQLSPIQGYRGKSNFMEFVPWVNTLGSLDAYSDTQPQHHRFGRFWAQPFCWWDPTPEYLDLRRQEYTRSSLLWTLSLLRSTYCQPDTWEQHQPPSLTSYTDNLWLYRHGSHRLIEGSRSKIQTIIYHLLNLVSLGTFQYPT